MENNITICNLLKFSCLVFSLSCFAAPPDFEAYRVNQLYSGINHSLNVDKDNGMHWDAARKQAINQPVNFAGHYIVFTDGCGGGSICGEVLDAMTGRVVTGLPNAYKMIGNDDGESYFDAYYKEDSRLMVISGVTADIEYGINGEKVPSKNRTRYYEFNGVKFKLLKTED